MKKSTRAELAQRVETLRQMLVSGRSNISCCDYAQEEWGISRSQAYRLLRKSWAIIRADVGDVGLDRQDLISWAVHHLMEVVARQSKSKTGNDAVVVGALRELSLLTGLSSNRLPRNGWHR